MEEIDEIAFNGEYKIPDFRFLILMWQEHRWDDNKFVEELEKASRHYATQRSKHFAAQARKETAEKIFAKLKTLDLKRYQAVALKDGKIEHDYIMFGPTYNELHQQFCGGEK